MKKILLMLLPMFIIIAVFFYFTNQTFNFSVFLDVISNWNFNNSYEILVDIRDEFEYSLHVIDVGYENNVLGLITDGIFNLLKNIITLPVASLRVIVSYVVELIDNVGNVLGYLLGW